MPELSFARVVAVAPVAFVVPLVLGLNPQLRVPSIVLEIVVGILIGPAGLGWVRPDLPVQVLALIASRFSCCSPASRSSSTESVGICSNSRD